MDEGYGGNVGGAPPPKPKRPTVIRPAQKPSGGEPQRPVPARPAPIARPSRPSPPQTQGGSISKEPTALPTSAPSPANGSRASVKNKGGPAGAPKKKLEITIVDARPMSEMGFRGIKGSVTSPTSPVDQDSPGKESPTVERPPRPSAQPPLQQAPSPSAPAASTDLLINLEPDPPAPVRPKRPTIIRPGAVKEKQQDETKDENNASEFPAEIVPPPKPARPSVRQQNKEQSSDSVESPSAGSSDSEALKRPARPSRPTIIRPQAQSKVSADQSLPEHKTAPSLPPPPSRPSQPPSGKPTVKPTHLISPPGAPPSLVPPSPKPRPRSTVLSSSEKENLIDLMSHESISPVPSPRPASRSPGEITPRSDVSSTGSSSGSEASHKSKPLPVSQSSVSPSAREIPDHSSHSAFPLLVTESQSKPSVNVSPPKPALPLPSPSGPPALPKRPSARPKSKGTEKSAPPAESLTPEDLEFKDDVAVYAKIDKSQKNTKAAASEAEHLNGKLKTESENVGLPFAVKLKPTVPTDDTSDTPPAIPPKTKPKPLAKPKPKPKPGATATKKPEGVNTQRSSSSSEQIDMNSDVSEGLKTKSPQAAENVLPDDAQEEPPPLKPKQISGSFFAKFEQMSASQSEVTENKDKPSNIPPVPSKRPLTIIGAPARQKKPQATQEQTSAPLVSEASESKVDTDDEKPSPPVPKKRPVTIIGFPRKNMGSKKTEASEENKENDEKDSDKNSIAAEQEREGDSCHSQGSSLPDSSSLSGPRENSQPQIPKPQESREPSAPVKETETSAVKQKPARPGGPPPRPSAPARKASSPGNNPPKTDDDRAPDPVSKKMPSKSDPTRPAPPKAQQKATEPPSLPVRPRPGHPLYHHMSKQPHGIALHDYTATQPDELSFQEGDTVVLVKEIDDQWMLGRVGSDEGMFPVAFLDIKHPLGTEAAAASANWQEAAADSWQDATGGDLGEKPDNLTGPRCRARFDFEGDGEGELALEDGDVIQLLARVGTEWFKGEVKGRVGIFPAPFVDIIQDLPQDGNTGLDITSTRVSAIFDFDGQEGELNFQAGDSIHILSQRNEEWLYGECNGIKGQFPSSFISHVPPNLPQYKEESYPKKDQHDEQRDEKKSKDKSQAKKDDVDSTSLPSNYVESREEILGYCRGMYDYDDTQPGDLVFKTGDRIEILEFISDDWARGRLGRKEGMFPLRFVAEEIIDESAPPVVIEPEPKEKSYGKAIHDFKGETIDDLTIKEGDVIEMEDIADINGHWQWGWLNGKRGLFPTAFVEAI